MSRINPYSEVATTISGSQIIIPGKETPGGVGGESTRELKRATQSGTIFRKAAEDNYQMQLLLLESFRIAQEKSSAPASTAQRHEMHLEAA